VVGIIGLRGRPESIEVFVRAGTLEFVRHVGGYGS